MPDDMMHNLTAGIGVINLPISSNPHTFRGYVIWRNGKLLNGFLSRKYTISRLSLICVYLHMPTII